MISRVTLYFGCVVSLGVLLCILSFGSYDDPKGSTTTSTDEEVIRQNTIQAVLRESPPPQELNEMVNTLADHPFRDDVSTPPITKPSTSLKTVHKFSAGKFEGSLQWSPEACIGEVLIQRKSECNIHTQWSRDHAFAEEYNQRYGPDTFRLRVVGPEVTAGEVAHRNHHQGKCHYKIPFAVQSSGVYRVNVQVAHESYNAVKDTKVDWYPYSLVQLIPWTANVEVTCEMKQQNVHPSSCKESWTRGPEDTTNYKSDRLYGGYWLPLKGGQDYPLKRYEEDILGRSTYGFKYTWKSCKTPTPLCKAKSCLLEVFRNKVITFLGDSHMRTTFYGVLQILEIPFAANRIWRGDRTDRIATHNITLRYIANYFLNLSRPTAMAALQGAAVLPKSQYLITGVGQHHGSFCWTVRAHREHVEEALERIHSIQSVIGTVWLGIPANPINTHINSVQHRKDCRNNNRLLLYNEAQRDAVVNRKGLKIGFVDAFESSVSMTHTNLDGAHYYTWVREDWISKIAFALQQLK